MQVVAKAGFTVSLHVGHYICLHTHEYLFLVLFNPLAVEGIYICPMNRLCIAARSALRIYVKGTSPTLLESAFDTLSPCASGLGIGHTWTKI